ncbi:MAG: hypothetical protein ACRD2O_18505 [Terriglobia bacterium]
MKVLTRKDSSSFRSSRPQDTPQHGLREAGYALIAMMIMATVLLISLGAVLPSVYQEAQRQKEQELIFRGNQYARAVYLFHAKMGRYPTSVKELLSTNDLRFLRQAYRDPMTRSGKWRFIHATANGIPIDSRTLTLTPQNQVNAAGGFGSSSTPSNSGGFGTSNSSQGFGNSTSTGSPGSSTPTNGQVNVQKPSPDCQNAQASNNSPTTEEAKPVFGTFIVGVASCSDHASIMVYNKKNQYSDWEFLGTTYIVTGIPGTVVPPAMQNPGTPATPGQGPGLPTANPSTPGTSPTGFGPPTGNQRDPFDFQQ